MAIENRLKTVATAVAPPVLRIALPLPFFRSGLTRWEGFLSLSEDTVFLFESEFKIHILGHLYPYPAPLACAHLVAVSEIVLPVLLMLGLATRLTATGMLVMTGMIQLTNPGDGQTFTYIGQQ